MMWGFKMINVGRQPVDVSSEFLLAESLPVPVTPLPSVSSIKPFLSQIAGVPS
jgi:hypothetical protein